MDTVISRRSGSFYGNIFLFAIVLCFADGLLISLTVGFARNGEVGKAFLLGVFITAITGLVVVGIKKLTDLTSRLIIYPNSIFYNGRHYSLKEIAKVQFTGKQKADILSLNNLEAASITFRNGKIILIADDFYANAAALKQGLYTAVTGENIKLVNEFRGHVTGTFIKGNLWINHRFLSLLVVTSLFGLFLFKLPVLPVVACITVIFSLLFYLIRKVFFYFGINEKYLVVKNHLTTNVRLFELDDIREVVMEYQGSRGPYGLRLILKDFNYKIYSASTLTEKQWREMHHELVTHNIKVRNETTLL
jgi:hypothetical protein